jgi:hypothetical protein
MSDGGSTGSNRGSAKRMEAKIALAMSRAQGNGASVAAVTAAVAALTASVAATAASVAALQARLANHSAILNGAPIGPAVNINFASNPFTSVSGKVRIMVSANVTGTGGTLVAGDQVLLGIFRDGAVSVGNFASIVIGTAAQANFPMFYAFDDVVVPGSTHTWGLNLHANNGHTITLGAGDGAVLLEEQG